MTTFKRTRTSKTGKKIIETVRKKGKTVSWLFGGKKYSGKEIKSMETLKNRYARTENGKIKVLPKR
jgi:hypothetical protein